MATQEAVAAAEQGRGEDEVQEWTCMGWRLNADDLKAQVWQRPNGKESWWPKKGLVGFADAGHVYRVTVSPTPDGEGVSAYIRGSKSPRYLRSERSEDITRWAILSEAAEARAVELAAGKNAAKTSELKTILAPLRDAYARAPRNQRRALLAAILAEVTWGALG